MTIATKLLWGVSAVLLLAAAALVWWVTDSEPKPTQANPASSVGVDVDASGNNATSLGSIQTSRTVACGEAFAIDVYITEVTDLRVWNVTFHYDPTIIGVYARDVRMFLAASAGSDVQDRSYGDQGLTGNSDLLASDVAEPPASESGSGVLARLSVKALAPGTTAANIEPALFAGNSGPISNPTPVDAQITVTGECATPVPTPTPEPTPSPTATATTTSTPTPTTTATPNPTTTATPTPPPPAGTIVLAEGWNASCYGGPAQPIEDALGDTLDQVLAIYRMSPNQGFDRWFPGRPEVSTITTLNSWDQLFVLASQESVWEQQPVESPTSVSLAFGWNSVCYLGEAEDPDTATAAIANTFAVLYALPDQAWQRYIPGRPELSNLAILHPRTAVLLLVTDTGGTQWIFNP